jgi:adenosylhomocysteine nucleosidase
MILILTGMNLEARRLARRLGLTPVSGRPWPHYRDRTFELVSVGLGATRLGARLEHLPPPSLVVSAGVCGALASHLVAGDLVVPEVVIHDGGIYPTARIGSLARSGTLLAARSVIGTPEEKARLLAQTGALAVDLESAAILEWAAARGAPAAVVRGVSDEAHIEIPPELQTLIAPTGAVRTGALARLALTNPRRLSTLVGLGAATKLALDAVAHALLRFEPE